ncbi:hypothetical protein AGMMS49521_2020 [Campylobacterota bacterium]|nr:hypothetical protein AGMMS49521_2020 [Campylobacterota bacterium]
MQVIFYRAKSGSWADKAIALWTHGGFSHCEILLDNGNMVSASQRENRVREKPHKYNPKKWEYVDLNYDYEQTQKVEEFLSAHIGNKYDWVGISGFVLPIKQAKSKWFCSELCAAALGFKNPDKISPNKLYKLLKEREQ